MGCNQRIAFKALAADGLSIEVKGEVVDDLGQKCALLQSVHLGMGSFVLNYQAGRKSYAHCLAKRGENRPLNCLSQRKTLSDWLLVGLAIFCGYLYYSLLLNLGNVR